MRSSFQNDIPHNDMAVEEGIGVVFLGSGKRSDLIYLLLTNSHEKLPVLFR